MGNKKLSEDEEKGLMRAWIVTMVLAFLGAIYLLRPFSSVLILAVLMAFLFNPLYLRMRRIIKTKKGLAVGLTTILSVFILGIPMIGILLIAISQGLSLISNLEVGTLSIDFSEGGTLTDIINSINQYIFELTGKADIVTEQGINDFIRSTAPKFFEAIVSGLIGIVTGIPNFIVVSIIYFFAFASILYNQEKIVETLQYISPFDGKINSLYLDRMGAMAKGMVKGQFIIAFLQGLVGAISLSVIGLGEYVLFFTLIFTVLNFIPLGSGMITIPLGILTILFGNFFGGAVILLTHFVLVSSIDNVLRPLLAPKEAKMSATLLLVGAFSGVAYFGFIGVVYGPILMIVIVTTVETFIKYRQSRGKVVEPYVPANLKKLKKSPAK